MTTWTDNANFTPLTACEAVAGSVVTSKYTFCDAAVFANDSVAINSGNGTAVLDAERLKVTVTTDVYPDFHAPTSVHDCPGRQFSSAISGDFDVQADIDFAAANNKDVAAISFFNSDADRAYAMYYNTSGAYNLRLVVFKNSVRFYQSLDIYPSGNTSQLRLTRSGNTFTAYWRQSSGDDWTACSSTTQALATTGSCDLVVSGAQNVYCHFDNLVFNSGFALDGEFTIHDSGVAYIDADAGNSWDFSEFANTLTGSPLIKYQYAGYDAPQSPTYNGAWLTLAELQAIENNECRYFYIKAQIDGEAVDSFDDFSGTEFQTDTTPPEVPTSTKFSLFETDNYAMIWVEPEDADFSHCELKRIVDEVTEYLGKVDGLPVWQESPTEFWKFDDGDTTDDTPWSNYTDEDVSGTDIAYYVRSVDLASNKSAFAVFTEGSSSADFPEPENVLTSDTTNGVAGTYQAPSASNVLEGTYFGAAGETEGTYSPDFPDRENVLNTDTVNGLAGRWHKALVASYEEDETFGVDGTSEVGTFEGAGEVPGAASIQTATAGDGQVTLDVIAALETDVVYARYFPVSGAWSGESETLKRTGSGTLVIPSLTNDTPYWFIVYVKTGEIMSVWSALVKATPVNPDTIIATYRVKEIQYNPSGDTKDLILERIERPITPK